MQADDNSAKTPLPKKEPWPMWPIALAIVVFIVGYTYITLNFRKDGEAYEPFQAMEDRRENIVDKNYYDWFRLKTERAENVSASVGSVTIKTVEQSKPLENVIPEQLVFYIPTRPVLLPNELSIDSDSEIVSGQPYKIRLELPQAIGQDERFHLQSFYKEGSIHLLASLFVKDIKDIDEAAFASPKGTFEFHIPTDPIEAKRAKCYLYNEGLLHTWSIPVTKPATESPES